MGMIYAWLDAKCGVSRDKARYLFFLKEILWLGRKVNFYRDISEDTEPSLVSLAMNFFLWEVTLENGALVLESQPRYRNSMNKIK